MGFFLGPDDFFSCTDWELRHHFRDGMMLFDSAGRAWRIDDVHDLGVRATFQERLAWFLGGEMLFHLIAYMIIEVEPASLGGLKTHVCAAIASNPERWLDGRPAASEDHAHPSEQDFLAILRDRVQQARSVPQIVRALHHALHHEELPAEELCPDDELRD